MFSLFLADIFKGPCTKFADQGHCNLRVRLYHDDSSYHLNTLNL